MYRGSFSAQSASHSVCGHCHQSPCRCGTPFLFGACLKAAHLGWGLMSSLKTTCFSHEDWSWCRIPCDTDVLVHALPGERRIIPYQVRNDTQCPVTVNLELGPWTLCGCEGQAVPDFKVELRPPGPFTLEPCGAASFDIVIDTSSLKACTCYCATLTLKGVCCDPVNIALCVGGKVPAMCRHDVSKLRAWVRTCCSTWKGPRYVVPAPIVDGCHDCD